MVRREDFGEGTCEGLPKNQSEPDSRKPPEKSVPGLWEGRRERDLGDPGPEKCTGLAASLRVRNGGKEVVGLRPGP